MHSLFVLLTLLATDESWVMVDRSRSGEFVLGTSYACCSYTMLAVALFHLHITLEPTNQQLLGLSVINVTNHLLCGVYVETLITDLSVDY